MSKLKTTLAATFATLLVLGAGGFAWAKSGGGCFGDHGSRLTARVAERLALDPGQTQKLDALADQLKAMRQQWRESRRSGIDEIQVLLAAPTLDRAKATALLEAREQAFQAHRSELVTAIADFTDSLTPEQRQQVATWIEHRAEGGRHRHWDARP